MAELSKLQIRAKVLSVVSQIKVLEEHNEEYLDQFTQELEQIDDRHCIFDVLLKEYIKMSENDYLFTGCLMKNLTDIEYIKDKSFEILKSPTYSDETKYKIVQLLRLTGAGFDYNQIPEYFENPNDILDTDTKKLLEKAVFNPESMLDFLDFVSNVSDKDRYMLLESLKEDYEGDILANIVYPILYSDFDNKFKLNTVDLLIKAKSSLAIEPFKYLIKTSSDSEIISACKKGLKELQLAGASEEKADKYFKKIISNSIPAEFYTTIPDGNGNQAILLSRIDKNQGGYLLAAVVVNDLSGIVDCFGFYNISQDELVKIINKFYRSEGKYKISAEYAKLRIEEASEVTIKNKKTFPYEFICWNVVTKDIETLKNADFEKAAKTKNISPSRDDILTLLTKDYSFRWYIKNTENKVLNDILNQIYNFDNLDIKDINNLIKSNENTIFDDNTLELWKKRLYQCIYLLNTNNKEADAEIFSSILNNEDNLHIFKMVIIQRSIFNHFFTIRENSKENVITTNIFRKKNLEKEQYDNKRIDCILNLLSRSWIHD